MKGIRVSHLVVLSALAWIVLTWFQVMWVVQAKNLSEEQFDQKVSMALCLAISALDSSTVVSYVEQENDVAAIDQQLKPEFYEAVDEALAFYDILLPYAVRIDGEGTPGCDPSSPYCCSVTPFSTEDGALISIAFPDKNKYLLGKQWPMLVASVIILLCILCLFVVTIRTLIQQKRVSQWNIDFFNTMAHELRTPLTNIKLAVQRLVKTNPHLATNKYLDVVLSEDEKTLQ